MVVNSIDIETQDMSHPENFTDEELFSILRAKIDENFPGATEPESNLRRRAEKTKRIVSKYVSAMDFNNSDCETTVSESDSPPKIVLLAHSRFLCEYKGLDVHPDTEVRDEIRFPNCQFIPDYTDYSKVDF